VAHNLVERTQRVRLLIETLEDPYPTARSALRSDSGPAASRYVPCETCRRSGWVRRRRGLSLLCLLCDGTGWKRRERGDVEWDAYVGLPVQEAVQLPVEPAVRPSRPDDDGYGWERLREAYDRSGSYREVRLRLQELGQRRPRRYHLIRMVLVERQPYELRPADRLDIDLGVLGVALRMSHVRVPPWLLEHDQQQTNDAVIALAGQGFRPEEIAKRLALPLDHVKRTMRRRRQRMSA
jgi:hypothetical protein